MAPETSLSFSHNGEGRTKTTLVEECSAINLRTSVRIFFAVFLCSFANPWCTSTLVGMWGNSVLSGATRSASRSVSLDQL